MALPKHYRFVLENKTGVAINAFVSSPFDGVDNLIVRMKHGPADAAVNPEASAVSLTNGGLIADLAFLILGSAQDNSVGQFEEGNGVLKVKTTGVPNGDVILYLAISPDGVIWPDDALLDIQLCVINFIVAGTKKRDFQF